MSASTEKTSFIPVILSGGSGTRLWPVSRTQFPKQFCSLFEESLFQKTISRLTPLGSPWVVTNHAMKTLTENVLTTNRIPLTQAIYETRANNTAPAIALLCKILELHHQSASIVGVFPSDHLIQNDDAFLKTVKLGIESAKKGQVVTLGIQPTHPATGYGYIEVEAGTAPIRKTLSFREKPNTQTAREFIESKNFFWNAGMFIFEVATMIKHFENFMPELYKTLAPLKIDLSNLATIYEQIAIKGKSCATSIDYGIMEKLSAQVCIPCDLGWSDVGSWDEIAKLSKSAAQIEINSKNNFTFANADSFSSQRLVSFVGVDDLIVVDTADALLITKKGATQDVKSVADTLNKQNDSRAHAHNFEIRPWGKFEIIRDTADFKSKIIHVNPGQQLSYQSHAKRAEHWVITKGFPEVILNDVTHKLKPGESIYIPIGAKHRIRNPNLDGKNQIVEFIEVQVGTYFGEDDIVRYQDDYQRK